MWNHEVAAAVAAVCGFCSYLRYTLHAIRLLSYPGTPKKGGSRHDEQVETSILFDFTRAPLQLGFNFYAPPRRLNLKRR